MVDISSVLTNVNADLSVLAEQTRAHVQAGNLAVANGVAFWMVAGDTLVAAKAQIPHGGWLKHLKDCDLSEDKAERYMHLARHRAELENSARVRNLSLNAALRLIKRPPGGSKSPRNKKKASATPKLDPIAWGGTSLEEQRKFLDAVGLNAELAAMPPASELARLQARIGELKNDKRRLEIENTGLRSEIAKLRSRLKPSDGNDHIAVLARKITALMRHPVQHTDAIYKAAAEILHIAKPEARNGKPTATSPAVENLDVAALGKAMALPAGTHQ